MRTHLTRASLTGLVAVLALLTGLVLPAVAQGGERTHVMRHVSLGSPVLSVHHGPVSVTLADEASDGHQLGDLRLVSVETTDADGEPLGRLDATLTTVAVDAPAPGDEIRLSTLVFSFGQDGADQVVVSGSAVYPAQGATIATGERTTRPIVGGSGRFSGATGSALSVHRDDGTWIHELHLGSERPGLGPVRRFAPGVGARLQTLWEACRQEGPEPDDAEQDLEPDDAEDRNGHPGRGNARGRGKAWGRDSVGERREGWDRHLAMACLRHLTGQSSSSSPAPATATVPAEGIVRTGLGIAEPGSAPGQELGLWRYRIPAGSELAPHTHAGWQLAHIAEGELTYTIIAGEGVMLRGDGSQEAVGPGTYVLAAGDGIVENPDLQHSGANLGDEDVIILATTLYPAGAPLSIPLEDVAE